MMLKNYLSITLIAFLILTHGISFGKPKKKITHTPTVHRIDDKEALLRKKADELAHKYIIVDGHVDLPYRLHAKMEDVSVQTAGGDFDYVRAKKGGLTAPFMSIYVPADLQRKKGFSKALADSLIDMVENLVKQYPDKFALAKSPADIETNFKKGLISLPMGMENGSPIESNLANLQYFYDRGIRYITLCHGEDNFICDTSYDTTNTWRGLSPIGRQVVREMNRLGIMLDCSHISDDTFAQVVALSKAPVIASHSSCRTFTPGFIRNAPDNLIKAMAKKGGVIMINYSSMFLDSISNKTYETKRTHLRQWQKEHNLVPKDSLAKAYEADYDKLHPTPLTNVERVADHIDHVKKIAGIDYVGLGSDFDGVGPTLPDGLKDCSQLPNLIYVLLKRGYTEKDIEKICYKNVFRVWNKVAEVAKGM
ncbi:MULTISPECIES: dipeptidase [unclassified Arcicella]|uniref:dipeptidase n=1 Tax=unclassified Arcicella TaxID=2644986 RepID=UPI00285F0CA7|nr:MULTISPECIES: dipeptidase [unclassified Arcicella]MDR6562693.1 membrane dipeptidase [Arcicella sp. BE51]MDR6812962.1 membrane dipeptidase [Arcicella sp. BE140]MDR6824276.1 membrane dipeptidase [Arcicella sp. BE139]